jgi:general secretion pathway protein H
MSQAGERAAAWGEGQRGFTLVELLAVLAILAVIVAALPGLVPGSRPTVELKAAARELALGLRQTRSLAIAGNRPEIFAVDVRAGRYTVGAEGSPRRLPGRLELALHTAADDLVDDAVGAIRFFPDGSSTGGRIALAGGGRALDVVVDWLTGRIEVREGHGGTG